LGGVAALATAKANPGGALALARRSLSSRRNSVKEDGEGGYFLISGCACVEIALPDLRVNLIAR